MDYLTDYINIAVTGSVIGMPQYGSLETFYQSLVSSGKLAATDSFYVTGHSLGGFLAEAFTAKHPELIRAAYTYNAPGFGGAGMQLLEFLGITDASTANGKIYNVRATDGVSATAGLGQMLGTVQQVRIEAGVADPIYYHSIATLTDTLSLYKAYSDLVPSLSIQATESLFVASGLGSRRLEDALDTLRTVFIGPASNDSNKTPTGDREAFFNNLTQLQNDTGFQALSGQVQLVPTNAGFAAAAQANTNTALAYRYALLELLPVAVVAGTDAQNQTLYGYYTQWLSLYDAGTGQGELTQSWIADRSSLLQGLIIRNTYDLDSTIALKGTASANYTYTDLASAQTVQFRGTANTAYGQQAQQVTFGNDLDNSLIGSDAVSYGNGDHLYGGKGNDYIDGKAGNDYLEGNAGGDTLIGGAGNDTLLGGAGVDTYLFTGSFGHDTVLDADGSGTIQINTDVLSGGIKLTDTIWESADKKYIYVVVGADLIIGQRTAPGAPTVTDTLIVKNWHPGELGLSPQTAAAPAPAPQSHLTVYQAYSPAANDQGSVTEVVDGQNTSTPSGADYTVARTTTTGQASITTTGPDSQFITADSWDQQISTGVGNDLVIAGQWELPAGSSDADIVNTGAGSDLVFTGQGLDIIDAGAGDDFIMSGGMAAVASMQSEDPANQVPVGASWVRAGMGSWGLYNDSELGDLGGRLAPYGISTAQVWQTGAGAVAGDIVDAGAGNDKVYGGQGNDLLRLGEGNDFAVGYAGADQIFGGDGIDLILGDGLYVTGAQWAGMPVVMLDNLRRSDSGNDQLHGGDGNDVLMGQVGDDQLYGDGGNDDLYGDDAAYLGAEAYDPALAATAQNSGRDTLDGGEGDDRLIGGGNDDSLFGGNGNDILVGDNNMTGVLPQSAHGNDVLDGGDGDDGLYGGGGSDLLLGGAGNDRLEGSSDGTVMVDVAWQAGDTLDGGEGADSLWGGAGNDLLLGGGGDDLLIGAGGLDTYVGGAGRDYLYIDSAGSLVHFDLGDGFDTIRMSQGVGNFTLELGEGINPANMVAFRNGNAMVVMFNAEGDGVSLEDFFVWDKALDTTTSLGEMRFSDGTVLDKVDIAVLAQQGTPGDDAIIVTTSAAVVDGGAGDDAIYTVPEVYAILYGGEGNDVLRVSNIGGEVTGGKGNDSIYGSTGYCIGWPTISIFYGAGDGFDYVRKHTELYGSIYLQANLDPSDIYVTQVGLDLQLQIRGMEGGIYWAYFYGGDPVSFNTQPGIDYLRFQDGSPTWNNARIRAEAARNGAALHGSDLQADTVVGAAAAETLIAGTLGGTLQGLGGDDRLVGSGQADVLEGGDGNDLLDGGLGDDILDGGAGDDNLYGRKGVDTYLFGRGDGVDTVRYSVVDGAGTTHIKFKSGVLASEVELHQVGNDLELRIAGTTDKIVLAKHFGELGRLGPGLSGLEQVEFADGTVWDASQLAQLIAQMSEAPVIGTAIFGYGGAEGTPFEVVIPETAFVDVDPGDQLTLTVSLANGQPLPAWLVFDASTRTLRGEPWYSDAQDIDVMVRATDTTGKSVSQTVGIHIYDSPQPIDFDGTAGDDVFQGGNAAELIYGNGGNDSLAGGAGHDAIYGGDGDDLVRGEAGNDSLFGEAGNDSLDGGAGVDKLTGGAGNDVFWVDDAADLPVEAASGGTDTVMTSVTWTLATNFENLTLTGTDNLGGTGNGVANVITGNAGNNTLSGAAGADTLVGGLGNDTYIVDAGTDVVTEGVGEGVDEVQSSVTYTLGLHVEVLRLTGTSAINATGNALDNLLVGNSAANTLSGGAGNDTMQGGLGNDTYVVDSAGDLVTENLGEGTDLVQTSVSYTLGANVENLTLTGTSAIAGTGNALNNTLTGNTGDNALDGGVGVDTLIGGAGNDTYYVDNAADVTTEAASAGTDTVIASVSWTLGTNLENLTLAGTASLNATGNTVANLLTGNSADNVLNGGAGADTLVGGLGNDTYVVDATIDVVTEGLNEGVDQVQAGVTWTLGANLENLTLTGTSAINGTGNALGNSLVGNSGNNVLDGAAGMDTLAGGLGNDTYVVDNVGDVIAENASEGTDLVQSSVTYTLSLNLENLTLTGTSAINATGNALNNTLTGNTGNNVLDGGVGADSMVGGTGNDTYYVDNAADVTTEAASAGTDAVIASVTWTLGTNLENLTLAGTANINATGNTVANVLTGNDGNNVLSGGAGADSMAGGLGNDTYVVDVATDVVTEALNAGTDLVQSAVTYTLGANVENLTLTGTTAINGTGNTLDNLLTGNTGKNILTGGAGNDTLAGGLGNDTLDGGAGTDLIVFNTALGSTNVDTIQNYTVVDDTIQLVRSTFAALPGTGAGTLAAAAFWTGTAAHDADDRIIFDSATGKLWYDADGNGATAAVQIAVLVGVVGTVTYAEFAVA